MFHAELAKQGGSGGAEAESGVFDYGLAGADRGEEVVEVVVAVAVAFGRDELLDSEIRWAGGWWVEGEFFAVLLEVESLHFGGEGADGVAGLFFEWSAVDCDGVACDFHGAFGAGEEEAFALFAAVDEVDAEAEIEAFGIVEECQQDIGGVAAVFPEAQAAGGHGVGGAGRAGDEVSAAEEVNEEVACDSAAVGLPFAPLEEVLGVPWNFGGGAEETRPVAGFGAGVERDGVVPGADGGVAVPVGGDHVEFADGSGRQEFFGLGVDDGADALAADLKNAVGGTGGGDDLGAVGVDVDHGLFEVDVFAGVHGVDGGLLVPVVGCGDDDGVDVFAGEDLFVVAGGEEIVAPELFGAGEAAVVAVGYSYEFDSGDAERGGGVALALDACADEGELDVVVGRCLGGCEGLEVRGCSREGGGLEKRAAIQERDRAI